ncbi:hypothetical protein [Dictyobacter kobayashii]|nr:hypothetical protein [Dictyobacter kobayashii]
MLNEEISSAVHPDDSTKAPFWINRNFALLAIGQVISNIGDFVYTMTLLVWVFSMTKSAAAVSGVLLAESIPMFVLGRWRVCLWIAGIGVLLCWFLIV